MDFNDNHENRKIIERITSLDFRNQKHKKRLRDLLVKKFNDESNDALYLNDDDLGMVAGGLRLTEEKDE